MPPTAALVRHDKTPIQDKTYLPDRQQPAPTCAGTHETVLEHDAGRVAGDDDACRLAAPGGRAEPGGRDFELVVALPHNVVARVQKQSAHVLRGFRRMFVARRGYHKQSRINTEDHSV